ncbi:MULTISPECIES: DUF5655 domain-containing protein [Gordonia]|uniref:DUF5655 domain-containing protein n=1 Tax=Gordonia TaxID=2053 RepID=UPI0002A65628|nr:MULTISPECIES: DUF5655 domain-containing protein [Gordonia]KAF0970545.1 hypothetical protein BPODLACK_00814 [Gordonia sp. YY1]MDJ0452164.1 DUF5655 domain-containing protein [Gordonia amicalis]MDV7074777.1 DUF5655 domain-containing protein [Gordonia amicalis]MDV7098912.1 DUF5655 domain-containing protein [Gordonia amicalis]MDV7172118.1 DUF5655 domain-containing protein [Gordonia amicalis]
MTTDTPHDVEDFFAGSPEGLSIHGAVEEAIRDLGDDIAVRVTKSQIAFQRRTGFAYVWRPGMYVRSDVPAVLSIALRHRVDSARFKEVAHPSPHVWMHHLEMRATADVDAEVRRVARRGLRRRGLTADQTCGAGTSSPRSSTVTECVSAPTAR